MIYFTHLAKWFLVQDKTLGLGKIGETLLGALYLKHRLHTYMKHRLRPKKSWSNLICTSCKFIILFMKLKKWPAISQTEKEMKTCHCSYMHVHVPKSHKTIILRKKNEHYKNETTSQTYALLILTSRPLFVVFPLTKNLGLNCNKCKKIINGVLYHRRYW